MNHWILPNCVKRFRVVHFFVVYITTFHCFSVVESWLFSHLGQQPVSGYILNIVL